MAQRGYLGKISAVVAINTGGVKPSLNAASKDIDSWGKTVQSRLTGTSGAAKRAFEGIFTPLQKLQAAVNAANRQPLDLRVPNVRSFLDLARATEQIAKPLGNASKQLTGLSQGVQSELLPALVSAQKQAGNLFDAISRGVKINERDFANTEARINRVVQAIGRANEASQATRGLASGQELRFQNPDFLRSTGRAAQLQQQAAALSPEAIAGRGIVSLVGQQRAAADEAERLRATIDRITVTRRGDAQAAQQAYSQQLAGLERINDALQEQITLANQATTASQQAANRRGAFDSRELDRRSGVLARQRGNAFEEATAGALAGGARQNEQFIGRAVVSVDSLIARIRELNQQYQALPARVQAGLAPQVDALNSIANAAVAGSAGVGTLEDAFNRTAIGIQNATDSEERFREAMERSLEEQQAARTAMQGNPTGTFGPTLPPGFASSSDAGLGQALGDGSRQIEILRRGIVSAKSEIEGLPRTIRDQFIPSVQDVEQEFRRLSALGPAATAADVDNLIARMRALQEQSSRTSRAMDFRERFGAGAGGFDRIFQDQAIRGYTAQLDILQSAIGKASASARGPAVVAFASLRDAIFQAFRAGTLESDSAQENIRNLTAEAVAATSAVAGIGRGTLGRQLTRAGDIGRAGVDKFSLGIQQAAFAIDDFFSVTGGIDQRLRAIGNNLTQLGFVVGGTAGLFTALAFTVGSQITLAIVKFIRGGADAEAIARAFNERLEKQKSLLSDVSSGLQDLGDSVAENAFSTATKRAQELDGKLSSLIKKLKELRDSTSSSLDPEVFLAEGRVETRRRALGQSDSVALTAARQASLRESERLATEARNRAAARNPITRDEISRAVGPGYTLPDNVTNNQQIRGILQQRQEELARVVDSWFYTFIEPFEQAAARQQIAGVAEALSRFDAGVVRRIESATRQVGGSASSFDRSVSRVNSRLDAARQLDGGTESSSSLRSQFEREAIAFRAAFKRYSEAVQNGREDEALAAAKVISELATLALAREREAAAILAASQATARFGEVLQKYRDLNDAILGEVSSAAEQARRQAVQAQGTASAGLTRRDDARFLQSRSESLQQELRAAEERRRSIESSALESQRRFQQESPDPAVRRLVEDSARQRAIIESQNTSDAAKAFARQMVLSLDEQLKQVFASSPQGRSLQGQLDAADAAARTAIERDSLIAGGRELSFTPGQRSRRELEDNVAKINAFFDDEVRRLNAADPFADVAGIEARRQDALRRAREDAMRQQAPAIFGLADAVTNALLQGPSRAALQPTDISTVEGSRELTRLLRGDDAARDQANLVELQREANRLLDIIANNPADIAN